MGKTCSYVVPDLPCAGEGRVEIEVAERGVGGVPGGGRRLGQAARVFMVQAGLGLLLTWRH